MGNKSDNESIMHSEKVTCEHKISGLLDKIKNDQKNNYGSYAALIGVILTIAGILLKVISKIIIAGYNKYFSISNTYNCIPETNIVSKLFDILLICIILIVPNLIMVIVIKNSKNSRSMIHNIFFVFLISIIVLFIVLCKMFDYNIFLIFKETTISEAFSYLKSSAIFCISIYCYGIFIGIAIKKNIWININFDNEIDKIVKKINAKKNKNKIVIILFVFLLIMWTFIFFNFGKSFAQLRRDYRLINDNSKVILAEKDGMYLCANCEYDESNKHLEIYSSKQSCINPEDIEMNVIRVYSVSISKDD